VNRILRKLEYLEGRFAKILFWFALLQFAILGIILAIFIRNLLKDLHAARAKLYTQYTTSTTRAEHPSREYLEKSLKNTLLDILEISSPVRMFVIGPSGVPCSKRPFSFLSWRFGADQCASSDGFLVTITPGSRRIQVFDLGSLSEDSA